jgi:hypothetical protein
VSDPAQLGFRAARDKQKKLKAFCFLRNVAMFERSSNVLAAYPKPFNFPGSFSLLDCIPSRPERLR